jgi:hypothetical protein
MASDPKQLVADFLSGKNGGMFPPLYEQLEPDAVWEAIVHLSRMELTPKQVALLAAGPLEDLLTYHGPGYIDRVETEARQRPKFRYLLGGVWGWSRMNREVWERVTRARGEVW